MQPLRLVSALVIFVLVVSGFSTTASAQESPTITFTFDFPGSEPSHYVLTVASEGRSHYESSGKLSPDSDTADSFRYDFNLPPALLSQIFKLAKQAKYFQGDVDSKKPNLAFTGSKTLAYKDTQRSHQANYNYSTVPAVSELTTMFQKLSTTMEFGHRLDYYARYQKLALSDELKRMEEMAVRNDLEALSAVAPILQKIADDNSVIRVVRARALRLLARGEAPGAPLRV